MSAAVMESWSEILPPVQYNIFQVKIYNNGSVDVDMISYSSEIKVTDEFF